MCNTSFFSTNIQLLETCIDNPWYITSIYLLAFGAAIGTHIFYNYKIQLNRLILQRINIDKNRTKDILFFTACVLCSIVFVVLIASNNIYILIVLFIGKVVGEMINMWTQTPDVLTRNNIFLHIKLQALKKRLIL